MSIVRVDEDFYCCAQILPDDLQDLADDGYKAVINNRPDFEQAGQPSSDILEAAAKEAGLLYFHIPVVPGKATDADVAAFEEVLNKVDGPVIAFCKTGMRAKGLHSMCQPNPDPNLKAMLTGKR